MDYIDIYCERIAPGFLSEPLNALSNISFFIAAWGIWILAKKESKITNSTSALITLLVSIGIGSTLFHTFATKWAELLDIVPILLFQVYYVWLYSIQIINMKYPQAGLLVVGFLLLSNFSDRFTNILNGSVAYVPAFLILLGLGIYHYKEHKHERLTLVSAAIIFICSLAFRTIDQSVCTYFQLGTHFIWHILNGFLLYLASRALVVNLVVENK